MASRSSYESVCLSLLDGNVGFTFEDGRTDYVPHHVVCSSSVLRQALSETSDMDKVSICVPSGVLQQWVQSKQLDAAGSDESFRICSLQVRTFMAPVAQ